MANAMPSWSGGVPAKGQRRGSPRRRLRAQRQGATVAHTTPWPTAPATAMALIRPSGPASPTGRGTVPVGMLASQPPR